MPKLSIVSPMKNKNNGKEKIESFTKVEFYFKGCMIRLYNIQFGYKLLKTFDIPKSYNVQHDNLREFWEKIIVMPLL